MNFLRLAMFKILLFNVNNFPLTSLQAFCQYSDERLAFEVGLNLLEKQLIYNSDALFSFTTTLPKILIESYKHAVTF